MSGSKARDDTLFGLEELWNTEKHRILNPILVYARPPGAWRDLFKVFPDEEPVEFKWIIHPDEVLKLGATRTLCVLRFSKNRPLPKVVMDGKLPVDVAIGDGKGHRNLMQESLDLIRGIVAEAKQLSKLS